MNLSQKSSKKFQLLFDCPQQKSKIISLLFLKAIFKVFGNINHIPQNNKSMKGKYFIKRPSQPHLQKDTTLLLNCSQKTTQYNRATHNTMVNQQSYRIKTEGPQLRSSSKQMVKLHGSQSNQKRNKQYFPTNKQNVKNRKSNKNVIRNTYNQRRVSDFEQIDNRNLHTMMNGKNRMSETKYVAKKSLHKINMRMRYKACSPTVKHRKMKQFEQPFEVQPFQNIIKQIFLEQKSKAKPRKKQLGPEDIAIEEMIGSGTFGKVFGARIKQTGEKIAVKKVQKDKKYKTRELQMLQLVKSPFIIKTFATFTTQQGKQEYINIAMQAFDQNFFQLLKVSRISQIQIKCYVYQMLRGLHYLHSRGICHRDLKPQNLLVKNKRLVICDFGSAKILRPGEQNISYICSRCYRAPELIFEATNQSTQIDMWSLGCILIEIINDRPLFIADSSLNHILQVIKILGTPTKDDIHAMNPNYDLSQYELPRIKSKSFKNLFPETDLLFLDLIEKIVKYSPQKRLTAAEALAHQYFDDLRNERTYRSIPYFQSLQLFFDFQKEILPLPLRDKLVPRWWRVSRK